MSDQHSPSHGSASDLYCTPSQLSLSSDALQATGISATHPLATDAHSADPFCDPRTFYPQCGHGCEPVDISSKLSDKELYYLKRVLEWLHEQPFDSETAKHRASRKDIREGWFRDRTCLHNRQGLSAIVAIIDSRLGVLKPETGLVNHIHTKTEHSTLLKPNSKFTAEELGFTEDEFRWFCIPDAKNPFMREENTRSTQSNTRPATQSSTQRNTLLPPLLLPRDPAQQPTQQSSQQSAQPSTQATVQSSFQRHPQLFPRSSLQTFHQSAPGASTSRRRRREDDSDLSRSEHRARRPRLDSYNVLEQQNVAGLVSGPLGYLTSDDTAPLGQFNFVSSGLAALSDQAAPGADEETNVIDDGGIVWLESTDNYDDASTFSENWVASSWEQDDIWRLSHARERTPTTGAAHRTIQDQPTWDSFPGDPDSMLAIAEARALQLDPQVRANPDLALEAVLGDLSGPMPPLTERDLQEIVAPHNPTVTGVPAAPSFGDLAHHTSDRNRILHPYLPRNHALPITPPEDDEQEMSITNASADLDTLFLPMVDFSDDAEELLSPVSNQHFD